MATKVAVRSTPTRDRSDEQKSKSIKPGTIAMAAAGVAAAAGAVYFLGLGERGARNREAVKSWAMKARAEVMERIERLKNVDAERYGKIVDSVVRRYKNMKKAGPGELVELSKELKDQWNEIKNQADRYTGRE